MAAAYNRGIPRSRLRSQSVGQESTRRASSIQTLSDGLDRDRNRSLPLGRLLLGVHKVARLPEQRDSAVRVLDLLPINESNAHPFGRAGIEYRA
jgi:hypothetical protein